MKLLCSITLFVFFFRLTLAQDDSIRKKDTDEYTVEIPAGWTFDTSGTNGTKFIMKSPSDGDNDTFSENINLIVQDLSSAPMSLDDYVELTMTQYMAMGVTVEENVQTANPTRQKLVLKTDQEGYSLRLIQYCWMVKDHAYVLTLTCLQDENDQHWDRGQKAMDSFKIK